MNKKLLIAEIIKELEAQKIQIEMSLKATLQAAIEAPGAMESHSDTTKSQMHTLADNLKNSLMEKKQAVSVLRNLPESQLQQSEMVQIGSVVEIQDPGDKQSFYFILPEGGGIEVKNGKQYVVVVTSHAPLAKILIGRKKGDSTKLQIPSSSGKDKDMTILNVW